LRKVKIKLAPKKTVELYAPDIKNWGVVSVRVYFVELDIERVYQIDSEAIKAWLEAHPTKTWKDYMAEVLLPVYDRLASAKEIKDWIES